MRGRKITNLDPMVKDINETILNYNLKSRVTEDVILALTPYDGQTVNKRLASAVQKTVGPEWTVSYDSGKMEVWNRDIGFNSRLIYRLYWGTDKKFDHAEFVRHQCAAYLSLRNHIPGLRAALSNLVLLTQDYNDALAKLDRAKNAFGPAAFVLSDHG